MPHYPISIDLNNRRCVVIGGGEVAERKVETLCEFGACVTVVAPDTTPHLAKMAADGAIELVSGTYEPSVLKEAFLVVAATNDRKVNKAVSEDAQKLGILVNVVDDPDLCTFFVPAIIRRGDLVVSISTSGNSPLLARRLRKQIELELGPEYGQLVELMGMLRDEVKKLYDDPIQRNRAYERVLDSDVLNLLRQGRRDDAIARARECILQSSV
jgi:precorrin-2 dehydrogenase/sirohydrochlorin ferrochelatase